MSLNRTKIEWTNYSWNPITGCNHGCWYCYARKMFARFHKSFKPTFYPERLGEPAKLKKPSKIFVCSVADLFAPWTPIEWMCKVVETIENCPVKHTFQLLTKNPELIGKNHQFPDNIWVGTTVTGIGDLKNINEIKKVKAKVKFVSFEPLLANIVRSKNPDFLYGLDWVIIGKLTGSKRVKLNPYWVERLLKQAHYCRIPVFIKNNVKWSYKIQEFPK